MDQKTKVWMYLASTVFMVLIGTTGDTSQGDTTGWVLYGAIIALLIRGLVITIAGLNVPENIERGSRSHHGRASR